MTEITPDLVVSLIRPEMVAVAAAAFAVGMLMKKVEKIPDQLILVGVVVTALVFALLVGGFNTNSVMQGIFCAFAAVFASNAKKQIAEAVGRKEHPPDET